MEESKITKLINVKYKKLHTDKLNLLSNISLKDHYLNRKILIKLSQKAF